MIWLACSKPGIVNNFLNTVEYLIERGNVRKASNDNAVKTMLIDAEYELITALKERQYLDKRGKANAFERRANAQTEAGITGEVANSRQGMGMDDYATIGDKQVIADPEKRGVEQQIASSLDELSDMDPVYSVENQGRNGRSNAEIAKDLVHEFGGETVTISREGYGSIVLDYKRILKALNNYLRSDAEIAAFSAVPSVLEKGREIAHHANHKGRGYSTTTFCAPITLNGTPVYLGVTVKETDQSRYFAHRVLMMYGKKAVLADINENTARNGGSVLQEAGTDTPDSGISGNNMPQDADAVKVQNLETPPETFSDIRTIYNGKGEGHSGVMNSRGMTTEDYMALDFSKNKLLQKNGKPYKTLYSGTPYAGFTVFDTGYADDGLSNFATNSKRIAQSYTWEGDSATEYDPRNADRDREQMDSKGRYLRVNEFGRYDKKGSFNESCEIL